MLLLNKLLNFFKKNYILIDYRNELWASRPKISVYIDNLQVEFIDEYEEEVDDIVEDLKIKYNITKVVEEYDKRRKI